MSDPGSASSAPLESDAADTRGLVGLGSLDVRPMGERAVLLTLPALADVEPHIFGRTISDKYL